MSCHKSPLLNRLHRIEGQVRGIARMVEEDRTCIDMLTPLRAARAALTRVEAELLNDRIGECARGVTTACSAEQRNEMAEELIRLLGRSG